MTLINWFYLRALSPGQTFMQRDVEQLIAGKENYA